MIDILLVEDHPMFRFGLASRLALEADLTVVGESGTVAEALRLAELLAPDVAVIDLELPDGSGLDLIAELGRMTPRTACLVLTMADDASAYAAVRFGAKGYLLKDTEPANVVAAIRAVAGGDVVLSAAVADRLLTAAAQQPQPSPGASALGLSAREESVLRLMAAGLTNAAIAQRLDVTQKTVRNYVSNVIGKLQASDRTDAILRGRRIFHPSDDQSRP